MTHLPPDLLSDLSAPERDALSEIRADCERIFSRRSSKCSSTCSLQLILRKLRKFVGLPVEEGHARRADACGIFWVSKGVVVNTQRLPVIFGKGRSWINDHLTRLGYLTVGNGTQLEVALEMAAVLGPARYDAKKSSHWTFRSCTPSADEPCSGGDEGVWACDVQMWSEGPDSFD
jgi:hypothetical protein